MFVLLALLFVFIECDIKPVVDLEKTGRMVRLPKDCNYCIKHAELKEDITLHDTCPMSLTNALFTQCVQLANTTKVSEIEACCKRDDCAQHGKCKK